MPTVREPQKISRMQNPHSDSIFQSEKDQTRLSVGITDRMSIRAAVKSSSFIVGLVRALRGIGTDVRVLSGVIVRRQVVEAYLRKNEIRKLHIGASNNFLEGWLNTDIVPVQPGVIYLDATRRFPFGEATFDYVMAEHMI